MINKKGAIKNHSRGVVAASLTIAAVLTATRPIIPAKVYAEPNTYEWTRLEDIDRLGGWIESVASSATGNSLAVAVSYGGNSEESSPLYISEDNGATWENVAPIIDPGMSHNWRAVDVSNDGQTIVASSDSKIEIGGSDSENGAVFISEDGGDNWTDITPADESDWEFTVISGDGSKIVTLTDDVEDFAYISNDGGDTWETSEVGYVWEWHSLAISDDGSKILVGGEYGTAQLFLSEDGGATDNWGNITPELDYYAFDSIVSISDDGDKIVTAFSENDSGDYYENVFVSENDGASWTDITPINEDENYYSAIAMSGDGNKISVVGSASGNMFITDDGGDNWTEEDPGLDYDDGYIDWTSADFNADGSTFIASGGEDVYLTTEDPNTDNNPEEQVITFPNSEDGKIVVLTLPDGTTVTCHSAVKESNLSVQDAGYNYPVGLVDFCFDTDSEANEVSITFVTNLKPNQVIARKFNPETKQYTTVEDVTIVETSYNSQPALRLTYTIIDNGPLDLDPDVGEIADPIGLANALGTPNTGISSVRDRLFVNK